jgi:hypothetical protein
MFSLHGVLLLVYLAVLIWGFPDDDAAFENGVFQFGLGGIYLGLVLASALSNVWVVAQVEVGFGVFALIFSAIGVARDWITQRLLFVSIFNTIWVVGLLVTLIATVIHYIALQRYRRVLRQVYGTSSAESIVFGQITADQGAAKRQTQESFQQLLEDERSKPFDDDFGYLGAAVDKTANAVFTVVRLGRKGNRKILP